MTDEAMRARAREEAQRLCNGFFAGHQELYEDEIAKAFEAAIRAAVAGEKERAAKIADRYAVQKGFFVGYDIAAAIRGEKP
jgi:hypothetical protein